MGTVQATLPDGAPLRLRVGTPADGPALMAGFEELGEESRYRRFFTAKPHLTEPMREHLVAVDRDNNVAIGAFDPTKPAVVADVDGAGVGVVRLVRDQADREQAEFSIAVIDAYHGRGVGRLLMEAAVVVADQIGIRRLLGTVLAENLAMRGLAAALGAVATVGDDPAVIHLAIDVGAVIGAIDETRRKDLASLW